MAYVPDPTDTTQPTDGIIAETAAAEFRALKLYIASLVGLPNSLNLYRRNKVINGRQLIDQRLAGAATGNIAATKTYDSDRFSGQGVAAAGTFTLQRLSTGLANASSVNFLRAKVTTLDAAPAAGSAYRMSTVIEGVDCAELYWGTAGAKGVALSFIAQSSIAGNYTFSLTNAAGTRSYVGAFAIALANTPQYFQIALPGDTAGVWATDNTAGIIIEWNLGCGVTFQGNFGWQAGVFKATPTTVSLINTLNATLDITDVQLEQAGAASPIEIVLFEEILVKCQRYYEIGSISQIFHAGAAVNYGQGVNFKITKRVAPSMTSAGSALSNITSVNVDLFTVDAFRTVLAATAAGQSFGTIAWTANSDF